MSSVGSVGCPGDGVRSEGPSKFGFVITFTLLPKDEDEPEVSKMYK